MYKRQVYDLFGQDDEDDEDGDDGDGDDTDDEEFDLAEDIADSSGAADETSGVDVDDIPGIDEDDSGDAARV